MPRIHVSLALVAGLLLAAPLGAIAAPPELRVTATCETAAAAIPGTTTATIALTAGTDDATGQPTQVSALDFALTFPSTLTATGVRLAAALAASGAWSAPDWEGSIFPGQPAPPGRIHVALAPWPTTPLPVFPAGPLMEIDLAVDAAAAPSCAVLAYVPGSVVFSTPPLGQAIPGGSAVDGGIELRGEVCDDCADNNGDGAVDLADPGCGAIPLTLKRMKVASDVAKPSRLTADIPGFLTSLDGGVRLSVAVDGTVVLCELLPADTSTSKRNGTFRLQGPGPVAELSLNPQRRRGRMRLTAVLTGIDFPPAARRLDVSLHAGAKRFQGTGVLLMRGNSIGLR